MARHWAATDPGAGGKRYNADGGRIFTPHRHLRAIQNSFENVLTGKVKGLMDSRTFAAAAGLLNVLDVPISICEYINKKGEGRRFNLESFEIRHETDPNRVVVNLLIGPKGAEQVEPFKVSVVLGDAAARQLTDALEKVLASETP